jgi:hypothetical protein
LLLSLLLVQAGPPDLTQAALQERGSYEFARGLTDDVGARQAGSPRVSSICRDDETCDCARLAVT